MSSLPVIAAFLSFLLFFVAGRFRNIAAVAGWTCLVLSLWSEFPAFVHEKNFLYPLLSLLSLPFLAITVERLIRNDPVVLRLSLTAAIAMVIWFPFAAIPGLSSLLISIVVTLVVAVVSALGHHPQLTAWDVIAENGFYNQIILGCTGIMAIAMMLGIIFAQENLSLRQAVPAFILAVPLIFFLNVLRVAVVFIAVSDRWFAVFPDPTGTGDPNFFWAHNVIAEALALVFLLVLVIALARIIPGLGTFARSLLDVYSGRLRYFAGIADDSL